MKKALIINAHQHYEGWAEGSLNQLLVTTAKNSLESLGYQIITTDVDKGYNIEQEVNKHVESDIVIIQTPMYWMATPWIFKKYIDEVFNFGLGSALSKNDGRSRHEPTKNYGTGGLMQGRKLLISVTLNAPEEAFNEDEFFNGRSVDEVFIWLHKAYQFNGFTSLEGFSSHDVKKNPSIENDIERYQRHLDKATSNLM
ncbi:NAD(P)H-dependent oxidoreductase [Salinicola rhizosphaerae]|uniref:NADPH quinone reductase MdaB n=1 Tax=Salinicola rhizosphaerae TaxID=1443141 RepID=A0ABQ3EH95_9GAMM|nr:NAD(P)H-dependent oxidoreductase [Salinicola rhizosphaerae]GHB34682.1 NADPH quinone reductase MdaB [Salinicola rhizosphaerae]